MNSRPLTYVEDGEDGLNYSLTPSHLINGRKIYTSPNNSQHHKIVSILPTTLLQKDTSYKGGCFHNSL